MSDLNLKIGLLAPTKGGKTTLLATTMQEISDILKGNPFGAKFYADGQKTKDAIVRKLAEYKAVFALNDPFAIPRLDGSIQTEDYKFALSVPTDGDAMRLRLWFKDFPGGWIGDTVIEDEIGPFLREAKAIIVPIASDFLMAWFDSQGKSDPALVERNVAAQVSLQADDILSILSEWISERVDNGEHPYIAFAPLRCECYFDDNGGIRNESDKLFKAVQECFVKPLFEQLDEAQSDSVKVEIHAIDTYGIVELAETKVIGGQLESTFVRRVNPNAKRGQFASKGSFALLTRLLNYEMDEMARGLGVEREELEYKIRERNLLQDLFFAIFKGADKKMKQLARVMSENDTLVECIAAFKKLAPPDALRQRIVCNSGETLLPPNEDDGGDDFDE